MENGVRPFTHITLDLFYLPKSVDSYKYVVIAIDSFTKWPKGTPLYERDSKTLADWLHREVVCRYGAPSIVCTDNGGEFLGFFHTYLMNNNILYVVGSPAHPKT